MNENKLKRLGYVGLGLDVIACIFLVVLFISNKIFDYSINTPDFVIILLWIGFAICMISVFLRKGLK